MREERSEQQNVREVKGIKRVLRIASRQRRVSLNNSCVRASNDNGQNRQTKPNNLRQRRPRNAAAKGQG